MFFKQNCLTYRIGKSLKIGRCLLTHGSAYYCRQRDSRNDQLIKQMKHHCVMNSGKLLKNCKLDATLMPISPKKVYSNLLGIPARSVRHQVYKV